MSTRARFAHALAAAGCALALTAAGCGGEDDGGGSAGDDRPSAPASTNGGASASADGKELFGANCASCHTLAAADANGSFGPNLDEARPEAARVAAKVKGGGGGMPSFDGQLDDAEISAVAEYVAQNAGK